MLLLKLDDGVSCYLLLYAFVKYIIVIIKCICITARAQVPYVLRINQDFCHSPRSLQGNLALIS